RHAEGSVLPLTAHAFGGLHAAGGQAGDAVDPHQALPARTGETEGSPGAVVLDRARERGHARAQERAGDAVLGLGFDGVAVDEDPRHLEHEMATLLPRE